MAVSHASGPVIGTKNRPGNWITPDALPVDYRPVRNGGPSPTAPCPCWGRFAYPKSVSREQLCAECGDDPAADQMPVYAHGMSVQTGCN
jgi:hypothetical protein